MNSKLILIGLLFFQTILAQAQSDYNSEGLQVTRGDLEQNVFSKDSTASALILYEIGNSYVNKNSFNLNTEISRKIKIINKNGFEKATETIYLYQGRKGRKEKVKNIKANVYNIENGQVTSSKLNDEDIVEEDYNESYKIIKFTLPGIKEGSVITYSYVIESPYLFKYKGWRFQDDIPKLYSEYNASIPGNWDYNIKLVSSQELAINEVGTSNRCLVSGDAYSNCSNYRYAMKDIPAFIDEDFMTTRENYLARIEYELKTFRSFDGRVENYTKSWLDTDNEIKNSTDFGEQLKKISVTRNLIDSSIKDEKDSRKKARLIYEFVQNNYTWNESFTLFDKVSIKNVTKEKSGSAAEINILLHNLLKDSGFEVKPLLISTRQNGVITKLFPIVTDFNYMIVHIEIDGEIYLLDATDKYLSFGQIPFRCLNQYGRLLDLEGPSSWYDIAVNDLSTQSFRGELNFNEEAELIGTFEYKTNGYHALSPKKLYLNNANSFFEKMANNYPSIEFQNLKIETVEKTDPEFNATFDIQSNSDMSGTIVYLNPFIFPFFTENPFKLQERSYPVDFGYKDIYSYMVKINIDDSYVIKEVPEKLNLSLPNNTGSVTSNFMVNNNTVIGIFKLSFNEAIYNASYYVYLKKLMESAVNTQKNTIIVLEKKS